MFESAEDLIERSRVKGFSHSYLPEKGELPPSQRIIGTQSNAVVTADSCDRDIRVDLGKFESNLVSAHNVVTSTGSSGIGVGSVRERCRVPIAVTSAVRSDVNVSPATFSPASLLFPFSHQSPFAPSQISSSSSIPSMLPPPAVSSAPASSSSSLSQSSASSSLTKLSSSSSSSTSSSSLPSAVTPSLVNTVTPSTPSSPFSLPRFNAGVLGLLKAYRKMIRHFYRYNVQYHRAYVSDNFPVLLVDFDKDHQGGDSVYLGSLRVSAAFPHPVSVPVSEVCNSSDTNLL